MRKRQKPSCPTVVRKGTSKNLAYLQEHGPISGDFAPDIVLPNYTYKKRCPITGSVLSIEPITSGEPTHGV